MRLNVSERGASQSISRIYAIYVWQQKTYINKLKLTLTTCKYIWRKANKQIKSIYDPSYDLTYNWSTHVGVKIFQLVVVSSGLKYTIECHVNYN